MEDKKENREEVEKIMKNEEIIQKVIKYQTDTLEVLMNKARKDERLKWKLKIGDLRDDLYDKLPVGEIKDAFEMIKIINKHMKELDKLVEGEI